MNSRKTVAVVGRGIVGLAVARELVLAGARVTLIGPQNRRGSATRAAQGISSTKGLVVGNTPFFREKISGHAGLSAWLEGIERDSGQSLPIHRGGVWESGTTSQHYREIVDRVFRREPRGIFGADSGLMPEPFTGALRAGSSLTGVVESDLARDLRYPGDLWFDPGACLDAIEKWLIKSYVTIFPEEVLAVERGRVHLVSGSLPETFDEVVIAAGPWSAEVLSASGAALPGGLFVEVGGTGILSRPKDGPSAIKESSNRSSQTRQGDLCVVSGKLSIAVISGTLRAGSTTNPELGRLASDEAIAREAGDLAAQIPGAFGRHAGSVDKMLKHQGYLPTWGVRVRTRDRMPVVGSVPLAGGGRLWVATAFYKNGLQIAHTAAKTICSEIMNGPVARSRSPFSSARFVESTK